MVYLPIAIFDLSVSAALCRDTQVKAARRQSCQILLDSQRYTTPFKHGVRAALLT